MICVICSSSPSPHWSAASQEMELEAFRSKSVTPTARSVSAVGTIPPEWGKTRSSRLSANDVLRCCVSLRLEIRDRHPICRYEGRQRLKPHIFASFRHGLKLCPFKSFNFNDWPSNHAPTSPTHCTGRLVAR